MSVQSVSSSAQDNLAGDNISPGGFDYNRIDGVQGNPNVTEAFIAEVEAMAERLGTQPEYLMAVMSFESGGSFSPGVPNAAGSGATGLIQFMPNTAQELGTSTEALARMSAVDQLEYVERYFNNRSDPGDLNTLEGVYTTVLHGSPRPDPDSTLFAQGTAAYRMNAPLDVNGDGRITSGEATSFVRARIDGEAPPPQDPATQPASQPTTQSGPVADPVATTPRGDDYTIIGGDILSRIAMRFGTDWRSLASDNGLLNPDLIHPGQTLRMPGGPTAPDPVAGPVVEPVSGDGARTDRNAFYLAQPDKWSCGPTALTMALAAWGVRPANMDTRNEAVGLIGQDWGSGVPGDASLVAEGARNAGLQASFNPDGSAAAVRAALDAGHTVVLNGGLSGGGGHFLYVAGVDGNGNFIIGDPARPDVTTMTAAELEAFSFANPGQHPNGFAEIWR